MIQESEIRQKLAEVAARRLSLDELHSWLNARDINMHNDSDPAAVRLAALVDIVLAERFLGDRSDAGALDALSRIASNLSVSIPADVAEPHSISEITATSTSQSDSLELQLA